MRRLSNLTLESKQGECAILILTRRVSEAIIINDDITITVLGIKGHQVRLGIVAPKEVTIHREEIFKRIQQEKAEKEKSA